MAGAASAPLCCAGLRSAPAARELVYAMGKKLQAGIGESAEAWHFTLGEDKRWPE
jgi:hypothetical protein